MDRPAVGAAAALYPDGLFEGLKIPKNKPVPPKPGASAGRTAGGLLPGVSSAEVAKFLYINPGV